MANLETREVSTKGVSADADDPSEEDERAGAGDLEEKVQIYCCQRCRCALFTESQLTSQHKKGQHKFSFRKDRGKSGESSAVSALRSSSSSECSSLFLSEPNLWMTQLAMSLSVVGKLNCPKCGHRVGSFSWSGSQCSCGTWIVPAIQIPVSKIDPRQIPHQALPEHVADFPTRNLEPNIEAIPDPGSKTQQKETDSPKDPRIGKHLAWLEAFNDGNVQSLKKMIDTKECSFTTAQSKVFDGFPLMSNVLENICPKLKGRVTLLAGPVTMPLPSLSTRLVYTLIGTQIGEAISWSGPENSAKVQHVLRRKLNLSDSSSFLGTPTDATLKENEKN